MTLDVTPAGQPHKIRPFYWSVRRELWENRAIHLAPLIAAGVVLLGVLISHVHPLAIMPGAHTALSRMGELMAGRLFYLLVASVIFAASALTGLFYCLGALHGERRDRSILFWKSLPVSDTTTVLAKAVVPFAVAPAVAFVVICVTQLILIADARVVFAIRHGDDTLAHFPLLRLLGEQLYELAVIIPWYAPLWAWLLAVSAWAKRTTFLWGVGPPLAACAVERLAFGTSNLWQLLRSRLSPPDVQAFDYVPHGLAVDPFPSLDPVKYLSSPDLWAGLALAAIALAATIWLRRRQEPI